MALATFDFTTLVRRMSAAVQGAASIALDLTPGSPLLAIIEAVAAMGLWLQGMVLSLLCLTRAATSTGSDLDSWMGDFSLDRLAATFASGQVTFSRFTAAQQAVIAIGTTMETGDGSQAFAVTLDITNAAYSASLGGYVLPAGVASVTVPVQAVVAGSGGNVGAGTISAITSATPGVDTVINAAGLTNALDAESDAAFRARFASYMASLGRATIGAVGYAVQSVQQGLQYQLVENQNADGSCHHGFFTVVVDDGSGTPSAAILTAVGNAVELYRGATISFAVFAPTILTAVPAMAITSASGTVHAAVVAAVGAALTAAINALPLGASLYYTQLAAIAYGVPGVVNVTAVLLNGGTADLTALPRNVIKCGIPVVS